MMTECWCLNVGAKLKHLTVILGRTVLIRKKYLKFPFSQHEILPSSAHNNSIVFDTYVN